MNEIVLGGCTSDPLANYQKALGVLRLVVEQGRDPSAKGYWHERTFVLVTDLTPDALTHFFLHEYHPTPLVAPWNGSTGFYPKDNQKTLETIRNAQAERLAPYRKTIRIAEAQIENLKLPVQPKDKDEKKRLLTRLRNHLPDEAVKWLDTCTLIGAGDLKFPPLTGTGGNDGNFEFSRTFMQQLQELIDFQSGDATPNAPLLLRAALFDDIVPGLSFVGKIGQFNPLAAGGANAAPGYDADSRVNPWDYVLMLEGILLFTAGATRRYEQSESGELAYPFTVRPSTVGYASASPSDEARAELWTPLWSNPTSFWELQVLFGEGRAKVGARAAQDGVDFARGLSRLGQGRGLTEFVRYSFQVRNGLSYFAIPLGRFEPKSTPQVDRLTELDRWLERFKRETADANTPSSVKRAQRKLETAIIALTQNRSDLLAVLMALGEVEAALDRSLKSIDDKRLSPIPRLRRDWLDDCDDGSVEFRLALALAGRNLRQRLVRVRDAQWIKDDDGKTVWQAGSLSKNLIALLKREEIESSRQEKQRDGESDKAETSTKAPQTGRAPTFPLAQLDDVMRWIEGYVDEERLEAIARGLCLVNLPKRRPRLTEPQLPIPPAYAMVAIVHNRTVRSEDITLPKVPALLSKLAAGDCVTATDLAQKRLYASGLQPAIREGIYEPPQRTQRLAAALAFPISEPDIDYLLKKIRKGKRNENGL